MQNISDDALHTLYNAFLRLETEEDCRDLLADRKSVV